MYIVFCGYEVQYNSERLCGAHDYYSQYDDKEKAIDIARSLVKGDDEYDWANVLDTDSGLVTFEIQAY